MASKKLPSKIISSPHFPIAQPALPPPSPPALTLNDLTDSMKKVMQHSDEKFKSLEDILNVKLEKVEEKINEKSNELKDEMLASVKFAVQSLVSHIDRLDDRVDEMKGDLQRLEIKSEEKIDIIQEEIITSQYREMEFALRVRGLRENSQENLEKEMINAMAPVIEYQPEELRLNVDKIFRVNSWVARQKNLPRDVVVYFTRRTIRNAIIQAFYANRFQIAKQEVIILKEIPSKMLKRRKDFFFVTQELKERKIQFRWDVPVGVVVNIAGVRYRLNTVDKAKEFYVHTLKAGSPPIMEGESQQGPKEASQQLLQVKPQEQRLTRAAHKRKEKDQKEKAEAGLAVQSVMAEPVGGARPKRPTASLHDAFGLQIDKNV